MTKEEIAKALGPAVAPYAFQVGQYYSNDKKYAHNVPFTDIETQAAEIARKFEDEKRELLVDILDLFAESDRDIVIKGAILEIADRHGLPTNEK